MQQERFAEDRPDPRSMFALLIIPPLHANKGHSMALNNHSGYGNIIFVHLVVFLGLSVLLRPYTPSWITSAIAKVLIGQGGQLPAAQITQLILYAGMILLVEALAENSR